MENRKIRLGGEINILGIKIPLGNLGLRDLEENREGLKKAGAREIISNETWKGGDRSIRRTGACPRCGRFHTGVCGIPSSAGFVSKRNIRSNPVSRKTARSVELPSPKFPIQRELFYDIFEEEGMLKILAEIPGIAEKDIQVEVIEQKETNEQFLLIQGKSSRLIYEKEIELKRRVKPRFSKKHQNGLLYITFTIEEE